MTSCNIHLFVMPTIKVESNFSICPDKKMEGSVLPSLRFISHITTHSIFSGFQQL